MSTRVSLVDRLEQDQQQLDPDVETAFVKQETSCRARRHVTNSSDKQ